MNVVRAPICFVWFCIAGLLSHPCLAEDQSDWPTLHGDLQRTAFYSHFPAGNLELVWRKELYTELTGPRCEVIVGNGLAFMGTYAGNLYAWDAATGEQAWAFETGGPIGHSPMVAEGRVYFGSMDRHLYCLDADSGEERWRFQAGAGIWTSPVVFHGLVLFGARDGVFYALDAATGKLSWNFRTGGRILNTASVTPNGERLLFASEDMHLYCLEVDDGRLIWQSRKLHGLSTRDYFPVIAGGLVFITTNPVKDFHTILDQHQRMLVSWTGFDGEDPRYIPGDESDVRREQERIVRFLKDHPKEQIFYAFRIEDGSEPWIAPILYTGGLHNPMTPPCYNPNTGKVYVFVRSAYGVWDGGGEVRPFTGVGELDLEAGRVNLIEHGYPSKNPDRPPGRKDMPWMVFNTIGDETQALACSSGRLFSIHQGYIGSLNLETGLCANLYGKRDTYGGFYGPGNFGWERDGGVENAHKAGEPYGVVNEWHGPARSIVSVAGRRVYFHVGSQVLCLKANNG